MNKSFRRIDVNRPRMNMYSQRNGVSVPPKNVHIYKKVLKQIAICTIIVALIILIKSVDTPITSKTTEIVKTSITKEMNFKKSMSQVLRYGQDIPNLPYKVANVFSSFGKQKIEGISFIAPMQGQIISNYGENTDPILNTKTFQTGIDILGSGSQAIFAVAEGEIIEIGLSDKYRNFIKIKHKEHIVSLYGNCGEIFVTKGQNVKKGAKIAETVNDLDSNNSMLHFELWIDGDVVDPANHMSFDTITL